MNRKPITTETIDTALWAITERLNANIDAETLQKLYELTVQAEKILDEAGVRSIFDAPLAREVAA